MERGCCGGSGGGWGGVVSAIGSEWERVVEEGADKSGSDDRAARSYMNGAAGRASRGSEEEEDDDGGGCLGLNSSSGDDFGVS
jgi:hypothetical protein